jgi:glycosyl transferase family 25
MRALIINMATATDRMAFMAGQMAHFGFAWERVEAVTPASLEPPADDPVWHCWERPLRVTEMALCASHMAALHRVIALDAPCLVLEDDAVLATGLLGFLTQVHGLHGIDHISLEVRGRRKSVGPLRADVAMRRLWQDRTGSAAYIVWPSGARRMLAHGRAAGAPSDALISSTPGMLSWQADPALAVQLDIAPRYGVPQALATTSLIDAVAKPLVTGPYSRAEIRAFRRRRILSQLRLGLRMLRGRRVAVRVAQDWPDISL